MKSSNQAQSATSLPRAPRDDVGARSTHYLIMMGIRIACFILMVVVTPYGWYTWIFGIAAIVLPYIAVVGANVGSNVAGTRREDPERALPATATAPVVPVPDSVIRIAEVPRITSADVATPSDTATPDDASPSGGAA